MLIVLICQRMEEDGVGKLAYSVGAGHCFGHLCDNFFSKSFKVEGNMQTIQNFKIIHSTIIINCIKIM